MLRGPTKPRGLRGYVYIPSLNVKHGGAGRGSKDVRKQELEAKKEADLLDAQLKELRRRQASLQKKLRDAKDMDLQLKLARRDNVNLAGDVDENQIAALESQLSRTSIQAGRAHNGHKTDALPRSIAALMDEGSNKPQSLNLFGQESRSWSTIVARLPPLPSNTPKQDVERLVSSIPLRQRAQLISKLESLIPSELQTQFVKDQLMAGFAELGRVDDVERILKTCSSPTIYSYGHWAKALFKVGSSPEEIFSVIKEVGKRNIGVSLPLMSCAIQSLIQHGRHSEAEKLFDNMKYWSVSTQPDVKLYNTMILSAAKQYNVNRCLDLLTEMKERRPYPLQPNEETYNYVVYACSREPEKQQMAWELFMEARDAGFKIDLQSFRALLYLSGKSGETLLCRALIRSLGSTSPQFVDNYAINCLFLSYQQWSPGPSTILSSPRGQNIRNNILMDGGNGNGPFEEGGIPLLPLAQMNKKLILLESKAVFEYFADTNPSILIVGNAASLATSPTTHNFLQVAINLGDGITEFKNRWVRFTKFIDDESEKNKLLPPENETTEESEVSQHPRFSAPRDQYLYRLAIQAAKKFKDLSFGRHIWTERGKWRRSSAFRSLPLEQRNAFDFQFARDVVELLAICGRVEEAILLVKSTRNLRQWKKHHLTTLIEICEQIEDTQSISQLMKIVRTPKD